MAKQKSFTAWVTTHALTSGIKVVEAKLGADDDTFIEYSVRGFWFHAHSQDWHQTPEAALARAEEMRQEAIVALKKRLAKLEKITFTVPSKPKA
jgi:hypothetical protein